MLIGTFHLADTVITLAEFRPMALPETRPGSLDQIVYRLITTDIQRGEVEEMLEFADHTTAVKAFASKITYEDTGEDL